MTNYFPRPFNGKDYIPPPHLTSPSPAPDTNDEEAVTFKRYVSNLKLGETWDMLALKYGNIDAAEDDEVDIMTGELISDRGHIRGLDSKLAFGGVDRDSDDAEGDEDDDSEHERELLEQHQALIHRQRTQRDQEDLDAFLRADMELHATHEAYYRDRKNKVDLPTIIDFSESDAEWQDLSDNSAEKNKSASKPKSGPRSSIKHSNKRRKSSVQSTPQKLHTSSDDEARNHKPTKPSLSSSTKFKNAIELSSSEDESSKDGDDVEKDKRSAWQSYSSSSGSSNSDNDSSDQIDVSRSAVKKYEYRNTTNNDDGDGDGDTSFDAFWKSKEKKYKIDGRSEDEEDTDDSAERRKRDRRMRPRDRRSMTLSSSSSSNESDSDKSIDRTRSTLHKSHKGKHRVNFSCASSDSSDDELTRRVKEIKLRQDSDENMFKKPSVPMSARKSRNVTPPRRTTILDGMRTAPAKSRKEPVTPTRSTGNRGTYTPSAARMQMTPSQRNENRLRRIEETLADERKTRTLLSGDRSGLTPMMKNIMISDTPRSSRKGHTQTPSRSGR